MMREHNFLYLIWEDSQTKRSYTVGRLERTPEGFSFEYSDEYESARRAGWPLIPAFPEVRRYASRELFPFFQSRLPDRKRRDIARILEEYGLEEYDGFNLLKNSGGRLPIDNFEFIDPIFDEDKTIERSFHIVLIQHKNGSEGADCSRDRHCEKGCKLILSRENDNSNDRYAVKVLTDKGELLGYIPHYYSRGVSDRLSRGMSYDCTVLDINQESNSEECVKVKLLMPKRN